MASAALARMRPWRSGRLPPIRGRWLLLIGLLALALIGWFLWSQYNANQNTRPNYQSSQVTQGTLRNTVAATGPIANPTSVPVSFKNPGELVEVNVSIGDRVQPGQILARQRPDDMATAVRQAEASYEQALAAEREVLEGPTNEVVGQADAALQEARVQRESAAKSLEATQATASTAINQAVNEVDQRAGQPGRGREGACASALEQRDVAIASAEQAVENAQVALENARIAHESAVSPGRHLERRGPDPGRDRPERRRRRQGEPGRHRGGRAAVRQRRSGLGGERPPGATRTPRKSSRPRRRTTERSSSSSGASATRPGISARSAQQERQEACANGNGNTTACSAAKRSENEARASLRTAEAQLNQAEASARQTMIQAASAVTNAQSTVRTAEASINTGLASTRQSNTSSRASVKSAEDALQHRDGVRRLDQDPERGERRPGQDLGRFGRGRRCARP